MHCGLWRLLNGGHHVETGKMLLPYGRGTLQINLKQHRLLGVLNGSSEETESAHLSEEEIVKRALNNPIGRPVIGSMVQPEETVCIIISDMTRAWQRMHIFLPLLVQTLSDAGVADGQIRFLCATGSHRPLTQDEAAVLLGPELSRRFRVFSHDCHDNDQLTEIGTTRHGTQVKLNRLAMDADHIILTGGIVFHDLAGWGGGKKSLLPGIAGYETIMANHSLSLGDTPGSGIHECVRCGSIAGNRLNEDMQEAADMVNPSFMLNVIVNNQGLIGAAVAGHYLEAFETGKALLDRTDRVYIDEAADMVVVSVGGYPKDIDFYQSTKALSSAKEAVRPGGVILLLCQCEDGIGHPEVSRLLTDFPTHNAREDEMRRAFTVSKFAGFLASQIAEDYHVFCVTDLAPETLQKIGFYTTSSLDEAVGAIERRFGTGLSTFVIPSGSNVLPGLKKA
jgi:lactate racemase